MNALALPGTGCGHSKPLSLNSVKKAVTKLSGIVAASSRETLSGTFPTRVYGWMVYSCSPRVRASPKEKAVTWACVSSYSAHTSK